MKKPNLPIIILCLAICVSGIAALSLKTFHTVNSTTSPYLLYLKVLQGNQQFYNVESGDYLDIHQLKELLSYHSTTQSITAALTVGLATVKTPKGKEHVKTIVATTFTNRLL